MEPFPTLHEKEGDEGTGKGKKDRRKKEEREGEKDKYLFSNFSVQSA